MKALHVSALLVVGTVIALNLNAWWEGPAWSRLLHTQAHFSKEAVLVPYVASKEDMQLKMDPANTGASGSTAPEGNGFQRQNTELTAERDELQERASNNAVIGQRVTVSKPLRQQNEELDTSEKRDELQQGTSNETKMKPSWDATLSESGAGVILFYHVAKTGGSSIRRIFETLSRDSAQLLIYRHYKNNIRGSGRAKASDAAGHSCVPQVTHHQRKPVLDDLDEFIKGHIQRNEKEQPPRPQQTLFVEVHGGSPGLEGLVPHIQVWRKLSWLHRKLFFAFTLVREPLQFAMSYFKYFHFKCRFRWCELDQYKRISEENLLLSTRKKVGNQQCFLLKYASSVEGMHPSFYKKCKVTEKDSNSAVSIRW